MGCWLLTAAIFGSAWWYVQYFIREKDKSFGLADGLSLTPHKVYHAFTPQLGIFRESRLARKRRGGGHP